MLSCRWMIPLLGLLAPLIAGTPGEGSRSLPPIQLDIRQFGRPSMQPLRIRSLDARVELSANLAEVALEFVVENPNPWPLEGELTLPVGEGQKVAGFALDMDGGLRNASVVERAKAEAAYASIVSRQVDPGILVQTGHSLYRIRIFPLQGQGCRRVRVNLEQALQAVPEGRLFRMPFRVEAPLHQGRLELHVPSQEAPPRIQESPLPALALAREGAGWKGAQTGAGLHWDGTLSVLLPQGQGEPVVRVAADRGRDYAFAHLDLPLLDEAKVAPRRILLAWDCSLSGRDRDLQREWAVLEDYLKAVPEAEVEVWAFNRTVFQRRCFPRAGRDLEPLKTHLMGLPADGTCDLGALDFAASRAQEAFLCSPGLSRLFKRNPAPAPFPVQVLLSSRHADLQRMRGLAEGSGGEVLDLTRRSRGEVRRLLRRDPLRFMGADLLEGQVEACLPSHPRPVRGEMGLACLLKTPQARLRLRFGRSGKVAFTREVLFRTGEGAPSPTPRRLWAMARLEEMEAERPETREALVAFAVEHGLVTRDTALLVLETLADYRRYRIPVPQEMRPLDGPRSAPEASPSQDPGPAARKASWDLQAWKEARLRWWSQPIPKGLAPVRDKGFIPSPRKGGLAFAPPPPPPQPPAPSWAAGLGCPGASPLPSLGYPGGGPGGDEDRLLRPGQRRPEGTREILGGPKEDRSMAYAGAGIPGAGSPGEASSAQPMAVAGASEEARRGGSFLLGGALPDLAALPEEDPGLPQAWPDPDPPRGAGAEPHPPRHWGLGGRRARLLAQAPARGRWALYLQYRDQCCRSVGFFVDCARIFARAGSRDLALGIASNLAEAPQGAGADPDGEGEGEPGLEASRLQALGELLWEMEDLPGAARALEAAQARESLDRGLALRRARLAQAQGRLPLALETLGEAIPGGAGEECFDPLQGVAQEIREALLASMGPQGGLPEKPLLWGLRIEVEGVFSNLPQGAVSVVDPRGERVWHDLPLGTQGLGLDDSADSLAVFMARRPAPGTYRVELNTALLMGDGHLPLEVRVRVTLGFGGPHPVTRTFRKGLAPDRQPFVAATFQVPAGARSAP